MAHWPLERVCSADVLIHRQDVGSGQAADAPARCWRKARYMPALDYELRAIVLRPFAVDRYRRLGELQAEIRRLGW